MASYFPANYWVGAAGSGEVLVVNNTLVGRSLAIMRGDRVSIPFEDVPLPANRDNVYFTLKRSRRETDANAILQVDEDHGLLVLNSADVSATRHAEASLVVVDLGNGLANISVVLEATVTKALDAGAGLFYDLQTNAGANVNTPIIGNAEIAEDVTRRTT